MNSFQATVTSNLPVIYRPTFTCHQPPHATRAVYIMKRTVYAEARFGNCQSPHANVLTKCSPWLGHSFCTDRRQAGKELTCGRESIRTDKDNFAHLNLQSHLKAWVDVPGFEVGSRF